MQLKETPLKHELHMKHSQLFDEQPKYICNGREPFYHLMHLLGSTINIFCSSLGGCFLIVFLFTQSVEEAECRRAYDSAVDTYNSCFDRKKQIEEVG